GSAILMSAECRNIQSIEKVPGVEGAVAVEIIRAAVIIIGARLGNGVDDATGSAAILSRVTVGQNRELADRVHSHVDAQGASGTGVRVIIYDQSIDPKGVVGRPAAGNGDSDAVAALGAAAIGLILRAIEVDTWLQQG